MDIFDAIRRAKEAGEKQVRIDFTSVEFLSSRAIGELVEARRLAHASGLRLVIVNASANVREVFKITRLSRIFDMEGDGGPEPPPRRIDNFLH